MKQLSISTSELSAARWAEYFERGIGKRYPSEDLVRILKGSYVQIPRSGRVLDVGFGSGAELMMFAQNGFEAHGLEIAPNILEQAATNAALLGVNLTLGLIDGTSLSYPPGYFDVVLSWNAVYYHGTRDGVAKAIREFHRVLRPGGVLLLSVIHPNSWMVRRLSEPGPDGAHTIDRASPIDARHGMQIFYDGTSSGWRRLLIPFAEVEEGYAEADLFSARYREAWRLFLARKAEDAVAAT